MNDTGTIITSREATQILDVALSTLTRWAADGIITPAWKLPGSNGAFMWRLTDIQDLAEQRSAAIQRHPSTRAKTTPAVTA